MGRGLRVVFLLMGVLALLVLGVVVLPAAIDRYEGEEDDYLLVFYAGALVVAATHWLVASARHRQSPLWLSVVLVVAAVPALLVGLVFGVLSFLALDDPRSVFILVPSILCTGTAVVVLWRECPRISAVHDERFSSRWAGGKRHDAV